MKIHIFDILNNDGYNIKSLARLYDNCDILVLE